MQDERINVVAGVAVVALIGGLVTTLLYTQRGRDSVRRLEDALDDLGRGLQHLRGTIHKAGKVAADGIDVAAEGMEVMTELMGSISERRRSTTTFPNSAAR